jgi:arylsulfatase A-like enzyme
VDLPAILRRAAAPLAVAVACLALAGPASAASALPNVVFLHADDQGWADVGFRGSSIDTPNIDDLAADGVTLDRYHTYPICGPTRAGLMTGRNPIRLGLTGNISSGEDGVALDEHMLPETFKAAGYQTWMMGKWHLGGTTSPAYLPQNRGFDHFYGFIGGAINETTHVAPSTGLLDWQRNGVDVPEDDGLLSTDLMATEAVSLIENRDTGRPFFLYLAFHALHTPYGAPQALIDKYTGLGLTGDARDYAAMAENMDANVGRVLDALDGEGIAADTLVVFASDNGAEQDKGGSNVPLRGWKNEVFEGGHRTVAMMRWPGVVPAGTTSEQFVSHLDWLPTLAAAVGIEPQNSKPLDGVDRWDALLDGDSGRPHGFVIRRGQGRVVLDGDWKLLRESNGDPWQLYDVYADPEETMDLALLYPSVVDDLAAYLDLIDNDADADFVEDETDPCTTLLHRSTPASPPDQNPAKLRLQLKKLDHAGGEQRVVLKGYFNPSTATPAVDPSTNGVHVYLADGAGVVFDVSVPGGLEGTSPCGDGDGWRVTASGSATKWLYRNKSGGLPDGAGGCSAGAASGIRRILVSDRTASSRRAFQFSLVAKDATLSAIPSVPLERMQLDFVLGAETSVGSAPEQAVLGQCAEFVVEGAPVPSSSPKPYCKLRPTLGPMRTIKCVGR